MNNFSCWKMKKNLLLVDLCVVFFSLILHLIEFMPKLELRPSVYSRLYTLFVIFYQIFNGCELQNYFNNSQTLQIV